jgi:hypothetical protein
MYQSNLLLITHELTSFDLSLEYGVRVHVEMRSKRELWVKSSLNSMKEEEEEEEEVLAKG